MEPLSIIGYIAFILGSILALFSRLPKQTIQNQKDLIETYEKRLATLEDQSKEDQRQHIQNVKDIADLQGQIKVYKELPLQQMASAMEEISRVNKSIADSNQKILKTLETSAETLEQNTKETMQGTAQVAIDLQKRK